MLTKELATAMMTRVTGTLFRSRPTVAICKWYLTVWHAEALRRTNVLKGLGRGVRTLRSIDTRFAMMNTGHGMGKWKTWYFAEMKRKR